MPLYMGRREWGEEWKEGREGSKGEGAILMFRLLISDGGGREGGLNSLYIR